MHTALTIAGSDSGGGAGLQADLRTFTAHGVFGTSAVTAVTAQNTLGVRAVFALAPGLVAAQIDAVAEDFTIAATKIGMLANAEIIAVVAAAIARHRLPFVVFDPVMLAKGGDSLLDPAAVTALVRDLLPLAAIVTPNIPEAAALIGHPIATITDMHAAARTLLTRGAKAVVIKGGHLDGAAIDVFSDGTTVREFSAPRIDSRHTHGTGCTFASAIAAQLALGLPLIDAVDLAKTYVTRAIETAPGLGHGHGPLGHG